MFILNGKNIKTATDMKEKYTVIVITQHPEQFLKYRNVTDIPKLFNFLRRKNIHPHHANVYDKGGAYLRREYPAN